MSDSRTVDMLLANARALSRTGEWSEVRELLAAEPAAKVHPELITLAAEAMLRTRSPSEAYDWLRECLPALERSGNRVERRRGLNLLGASQFELGYLEGAEEAFGRALEQARVDGDDLLVARATNNLGLIANIRGRRDEALSLYQLAIPAYQQLGHSLGLAESFHNMAITYRQLEQIDQSDEYEQRAIEFAREAGSAWLVAVARVGRAELSLRRSDARLAAASARRAAEDFAELSDPTMEADALRLAGVACAALGDVDHARQALNQAVVLARRHGNALIEAEARRARATLAAGEGEAEKAREDARAAAALFERLDAGPERDALERWIQELDARNPTEEN